MKDPDGLRLNPFAGLRVAITGGTSGLGLAVVRDVDLLRRGDLVIANDAATLPASLTGRHLPSGHPVEVRLAGRRSLSADEIRRFSHYDLLRAFTDDETLRSANQELYARDYGAHEFGDSIFIERKAARLCCPWQDSL